MSDTLEQLQLDISAQLKRDALPITELAEVYGLTLHWMCELFPMIEGDKFAKFIESVRHHGLFVPITLDHTGTLLVDGKIRLAACHEAGVEPTFRNLPMGADLNLCAFEQNMLRKNLTKVDEIEIRVCLARIRLLEQKQGA